jgi:diacylglycerol kinase family enzyme
MRIRLDGAEPLVREARAVVVGNVGTLPGGFTLLPGARVDDGLLDVGVLSPRSLVGWADLARRVVAQGHHSGGLAGDGANGGRRPGASFPAYASFEHFQAAAVEVSAASPLPRQFDGDLFPPGPTLKVHVAHQALRCRAPRGR